jgi:hypothetical protein
MLGFRWSSTKSHRQVIDVSILRFNLRSSIRLPLPQKARQPCYHRVVELVPVCVTFKPQPVRQIDDNPIFTRRKVAAVVAPIERSANPTTLRTRKLKSKRLRQGRCIDCGEKKTGFVERHRCRKCRGKINRRARARHPQGHWDSMPRRLTLRQRELLRRVLGRTDVPTSVSKRQPEPLAIVAALESSRT